MKEETNDYFVNPFSDTLLGVSIVYRRCRTIRFDGCGGGLAY